MTKDSDIDYLNGDDVEDMEGGDLDMDNLTRGLGYADSRRRYNPGKRRLVERYLDEKRLNREIGDIFSEEGY
ncbi:MAG TPA: hypothetical protein ENI99_03550 [Sedimenticola sp.]|nr:hypothetical protein [Sedimenticola sp.]